MTSNPVAVDINLLKQAHQRAKTDFRYFAKRCVSIRDKAGNLTPLVLNKTQEVILQTLEEAQQVGDVCRLIILKARQVGVSTLIQAYILWRMLKDSNITALEIAHDKDTARAVLGINRFAVKNLPQWFSSLEKLKEEYFTKYEISFASNGSSLTVSSAESIEPGRGKTIQLVHLSEMAFYQDAASITRPLFSAVPKTADSVIFIESTGNGPAGLFHAIFTKAWRAKQQGRKTSYQPLFFPWFFHDEYQMPLPEGHVPYCPDSLKQYNLTLEQLYWREWVIENDFNGDEEAFMLEFPGSVEEAFLRKDATLFSPGVIQARMQELEQLPQPTQGFLSEAVTKDETSPPVFTAAVKERLTVYKFPELGRLYVIGADTGSGVVINREGDYSSADVLDVFTGEQVAQLHLTVEPGTYAQELALLGRWYNDALIAVEADGHGLSVLTTLRDAGYYNLYQRRVFDKINNVWVGKLGWLSTKRTKKLIIDGLRADFYRNLVVINSKDTLTEMATFVKLSEKSDQVGAAPGAKDDRVISLAIGNQVRREIQTYEEKPGQAQEAAETQAQQLLKIASGGVFATPTQEPPQGIPDRQSFKELLGNRPQNWQQQENILF